MGLWINEPLLSPPGQIEVAVDALADAGYGIVRLFVRNSSYHHGSPEIVAAVKAATHRARSRGMFSVLDCEPHETIGRDMIRQHPDARGAKLLRQTANVIDGHWQIRAITPDGGGASSCFSGIEAAFLRHNGTVTSIQLQCSIDGYSGFYERNGQIHRDLTYEEGVPAQLSRVHLLRGSLEGVSGGELIVYLRYDYAAFVDFWAEGFRSYFNDLIERYRHVPLDGISWDEPAVDCDWGLYRWGASFPEAFKRLNGYDLREWLYLLDEPGLSIKSVKVRLDYYRTLNEGVAQAQEHVCTRAKSIFGIDCLLGTHHTWQGEGGINDYRAGAVDYFRLNDNMDAGYTDCSWWDPTSVAYSYTLASSLGRLTPSGVAEVNTWHYKPTVASIRRNVALMSLMNITWFNIWFGRDRDCVMQQGHSTWGETVAATARHRQAQAFIADRTPVVDVAVWHGWEGVCAWNKPDLANAHKTCCMNTSELFINRSIAMDFIDSRLLAESSIIDGRLTNRLGHYRILVVPYGLVMPKDAFAACQAFAQGGGRLIFVGTPVATDERGNPLAEAFASLLDMPTIQAEHYLAGLQAVCTLPSIRAQRLEVCRPLQAGLPRGLTSCEGEPHGVISMAGNTVFLTDLDPQDRLIDRITDILPTNIRGHGDNLLWRHYRGPDDDLIVVVPRSDRPLLGVICWDQEVIELSNGSIAMITRKNGHVEVSGDGTWKHLASSREKSKSRESPRSADAVASP